MSKGNNKQDAVGDGSWGFVEGLENIEQRDELRDIDALQEKHGDLARAWHDLIQELRYCRHAAIHGDEDWAYDAAQEVLAQLETIVDAEPGISVTEE